MDLEQPAAGRVLVVTGASGFIGSAFVEAARAAGWSVRTLTSTTLDQRSAAWRLGDPIPESSLRDVEAVVHLAHAWHQPADQSGAHTVNFRGSQDLIEACRKANVQRLVFASTISARENALNQYGREKWAIEQMMQKPTELIARIGLVYCRTPKGLWGTLWRLSRLRIVPMVGSNRCVQPIEMAELCAGLLAMLNLSCPGRRIYVLAGNAPISFGELLKSIAEIIHRRPLAIVPIPPSVVISAISLMERVFPVINRERLYGLIGLPVVESSTSLEELDLVLAPVKDRLREFARTRVLLEEGQCLLRYLLGGAPKPGMLRRYVRGIERFGGGAPLPLPRLAIRCPRLLSVLEPLRRKSQETGSVARTSLSSRLEMALILAESEPYGAARMYSYAARPMIKNVPEVFLTLCIESALLPIRLLRQRLFDDSSR